MRIRLGIVALTLTFAIGAGAAYLWRANPSCAALPGSQLLPNADFAADADHDGLPDGWGAAVKGPARRSDYTVTGKGFSLLLIGIANQLRSPAVAVSPGAEYCFVAQALTDPAPAPTRLQLRLRWLDAQDMPVGESRSDWLEVKTPVGGGWSQLRIGGQAPALATKLVVSLHPASDDPIYLDQIALRRGGWDSASTGFGVARAQALVPTSQASLAALAPWPKGKRAAVSFSFDWETAMGGLIHSRSAGDPHFDKDPLDRGMRMRQGVTETLAIFAPLGVRATYYATGYNFLSGNREHQIFMGDPTYPWANPENRWRRDWSGRKWFADDPHSDLGDAASQGAAWYFGDLVPLLQGAGQAIESHTFAHFYGGFVTPDDWRADFAAWQAVAALHGVVGPTSLAFPWSSSGGMSYAAWDVLAEAGVRSVTRLSDQAQYQLFEYNDEVPVAPRCLPLPGHAQILACPDIYLTPGNREQKALQAIDAALAAQGAVDIWAHTEEVTSPEQVATWRRVVEYAARKPELWVAPLAEIAAWQQAIAQVELRLLDSGSQHRVAVTNQSDLRLEGVVVNLPFRAAHTQVLSAQGQLLAAQDSAEGQAEVVLTLSPGETVEVRAWPA